MTRLEMIKEIVRHLNRLKWAAFVLLDDFELAKLLKVLRLTAGLRKLVVEPDHDKG